MASASNRRDEGAGGTSAFFVCDFSGPEGRVFFPQKRRWHFPARRLIIGPAGKGSTVCRLAATSVPHDQVNCRYDERIIVYCRGGRFQSGGTLYIWEQATPEAKAIIVFLLVFSIVVVVGDDFQSHPDAPRAEAELLFPRGIPRAKEGARNFRPQVCKSRAARFTRFIRPAACSWTRGCAGRPVNAPSNMSVSKTWSTSNAPWKTSSPRNR